MNRAYERWQCPRCGHWIDLRITPSTPPTCSNHVGGKVAVMVLVTQKVGA